MKYLFDISAIAIMTLIVAIFAGVGFFKSVFRFLRWIIAAFIAYLLGNWVASILFEKVLYQPILNGVTNKVQSICNSTVGTFNGETIYQKLPFFLKTGAVHEKLASMGEGEEAVGTISEALSKLAASIASKIAGYALVFAVAMILLWILTIVLSKVIKKSPLTHTVDSVLGGILGFAFAFLLLCMAVSIAKTFFADSPACADSFLIRWIGNLNILQGANIFNLGKRWLSEITL